MKIPRINNAVGNIDGDLIVGAEGGKPRGARRLWVKIGVIAACFVLVILIVALTALYFYDDDNNSQAIGDRDFNKVIVGGENGIVFPWEYMLDNERYTVVKYDGNEYNSRRRAVGEELLSESLGECSAKGFDSYTDKTYSEKFEARKINGVSEKHVIAVAMDGGYYVYFNSSAEQPKTLGELMELYSLEKTLPLLKFSDNAGHGENGYYELSDGSYIWQVLSECKDASAYENADSWNRGDRNYLSFTATSEALGVYKRVFYITEDGYVATNVFDYLYVYYVGTEATEKIISYARSNARQTEREQYHYSIAGTITEIGDGYILIDDSVLCADQNDGIVFKVLTDNKKIKAYLDFVGFSVGDTVVVNFEERVVLGEDNTVRGAISISKGTVHNGDMLIPE